VRSRRRLARLRVDDANPTASRFSPDGRLLVVGTRAGRVRAFSTATWRPAAPAWRAHAATVASIDVRADGRMLVTTGADGEVRLWDARSRRAIGSPLPGPENVAAVALFARGGTHVLFVFADGRGFRWDVRASSWVRHACTVAGRRLSRAEWEDALPGRPYAPAC